jgi:hypothetical protein
MGDHASKRDLARELHLLSDAGASLREQNLFLREVARVQVEVMVILRNELVELRRTARALQEQDRGA